MLELSSTTRKRFPPPFLSSVAAAAAAAAADLTLTDGDFNSRFLEQKHSRADVVMVGDEDKISSRVLLVQETDNKTSNIFCVLNATQQLLYDRDREFIFLSTSVLLPFFPRASGSNRSLS